jgi:hypothetical protein
LRSIVDPSLQGSLPLDDSLSKKQILPAAPLDTLPATSSNLPGNELDAVSLSLLGIVTELPTRYSPDQLAASLGADRVGMAGWIVDSRVGKDAELDEETIKMTIADLCERDLMRMTETRRLEATKKGEHLWQMMK